ncbi:MAG: hypothetical protein EYC62_00085 [Alphaproteobacteria bacterium]|nr:MAG: hypothetical protein EYC62_00085 [Alphaproteobacteria bacterium]
MIFRRRGKNPEVIDATKDQPVSPSSKGAAQTGSPSAGPSQNTMRKKRDVEVQDFSVNTPAPNASSKNSAASSNAVADNVPAGSRKKRPEVMVQDFTVDEAPPQMDKAQTLVEFLHPVNKLKKKVGEGASSFDVGIFVRAAEVVKNLAANYIEGIAPKELREISVTFQALQHFPDRSKENVAKLFSQAHEIKSSGGSYGYPLISRIADSLCKLTEGMSVPEKMDMMLIKFHLDALQVVVRKKIKGIGGEIGQLLIEGLEVVVAKRKAHDSSLVLEHIAKFLEKLDNA